MHRFLEELRFLLMRVYDVHEDGRGVDSDEAVCFFGYIAVPAPQWGWLDTASAVGEFTGETADRQDGFECFL